MLYNQAVLDVCTGALGGLSEYAGWFTILIVIVIGGGLVFMLKGDSEGIGDSTDIATLLIIAGVIIGLGGIIIVNIAGAGC